MALQAITIPPASGQPPRGTVVILHGWGASAKDVWSLASLVDLPDFQLVFPDAPFSHPYSAGGKMWYDFPNHFNFQSTPEFRTRKDLSRCWNAHRSARWKPRSLYRWDELRLC